MFTTPRTPAAAIRKGILKALIVFIMIGVPFASYTLTMDAAEFSTDTGPTTAPKIAGHKKFERLVEKGACWRNDGKEHPLPNTVVEAGASAYVYKGQKRTDWYLSDFSRIDINVVGFCSL